MESKKGPKGGIIEVFIDDKSKGTFDCYSAHASTQKVILAKGLSKGKHSFRGVLNRKNPALIIRNLIQSCMLVRVKVVF